MKKIIVIFLILVLKSAGINAQVNTAVSNKIANYSAVIKKGEVNLNWRIISPLNVYKFKIESKKAGTETYNFDSDVMFTNFRKKEENDSVTSYYYTYVNTPGENGVYFYKLTVFDIYNKTVSSEEIKIGISEVPEFKLFQNNPNPFNPTTIITYTVLVPTVVKIHVYSLTGQYVDVLADEFKNPGTYSVEFNTSKYPEISSGIYFYKLETNYSSDIKKMIFAK
jgi:hypothetical protein